MDGQNIEDQQVDTSTEAQPNDLASAFRMLKKENQEDAGNSVPPAEGEGGAGETGNAEEGQGLRQEVDEPSFEPDGNNQAGNDIIPDTSHIESEDNGIDNSLGGSIPLSQEIDLPGTRDGLRNEIRNHAIQETQRKFQEAGIKKIQIDDLYQRDENTGAVEFTNPDNPNRPFDSRYEAQQWVDAFNKQIDDRFNREATKAMNDIAANQRPMFELLDFVPEYEKMSQVEQEIFDELVEPYGVQNGAGDVVGFNVSLPAVAKQARSIAKRFQKEEAPKQAKTGSNESAIPAMDVKSSGSSTANTGKKQPKNLNEAFKMLNENKKKGN